MFTVNFFKRWIRRIKYRKWIKYFWLWVWCPEISSRKPSTFVPPPKFTALCQKISNKDMLTKIISMLWRFKKLFSSCWFMKLLATVSLLSLFSSLRKSISGNRSMNRETQYQTWSFSTLSSMLKVKFQKRT